MRKLAAFCLPFAAGVFAAQYLLPERLLLWAAAGCAALGALWALALRDDWRRRALLYGLGLALALCWDWGYGRLVAAPFEMMAGNTETLTLELADYPKTTEYGSRADVYIVGRGLHGKAVLYGGEELLGREPGSRVELNCEIRSAAQVRGEDVSSFRARGVYALLYGRGEAAVSDGNRGAAFYFPQRLARSLRDAIGESFPERTRPLMEALLLGDRDEMSEEDAACLREASLYHITAVSGLHCAFLVSLLVFLLGRHRLKLVSAVAIPLLVLYALTVGGSPSVVRACVMMIFVLVAPLFDRESDGTTALSAALFLLLARNPFAAKSVSLQLSFAAMAGLLWLAPRLYDRAFAKEREAENQLSARERRKNRAEKRSAGYRLRAGAKRFLWASLSATAGALVFTAPLSAAYFNTLVLVAPLSNLLCLWAVSLTFALGFLTMLAGLIWLPLAQCLAWAPHYGALYLLSAARLFASLPYHAVYFSNTALRLWLAYAYALFGVCFAAKRGRLRYMVAAVLAALTLVLVLWLNAMPLRGGALHVVVLDVGQGQSVVLHTEGATALIDCGSRSYGNAGEKAADYLQGAGVGTLDCVVLSHYHADHCNGLPVLFARLRVKRLILPDIEEGDELRAAVLALAEQNGVEVTFVRDEKLIVPLGEASLTVYPPAAEGDMNEECLAALCSAGTFDALFTGDMDANTEYLLIAKNKLPDVELLLAGHHGSRWSTGGDLLAEVKPETVVISCGADNSYGHPHRETLRRLTDAGADIFRTDLQGTVHITVN